MAARTLNEVYSQLSAQRRYEVWFVRLGLADHSGAWWFRYLLLNPARDRSATPSAGMPVQVWATWFGSDTLPHTCIQEFPVQALDLSARDASPFHFLVAENGIDDAGCHGYLNAQGHKIYWDLRVRSSFRVTLSDKGWIGFSRTAHSDGIFSGRIVLDGRVFEGDPLGFGIQGHNCGYRHRSHWTWAHAFFPREKNPSTLESLIYDMPLGLTFWKAVLWHDNHEYVFQRCRKSSFDRQQFRWQFQCERGDASLSAVIDGSGPNVHRIAYQKTDGSGTFDVLNNSLARATVHLDRPGLRVDDLETLTGAVLESAGKE